MKKKWKTEEEQILAFIKNAHTEVEEATVLFNELTDSAAIDYASYNLLAAKTKYSNLIRLAKEKGMSV
ncbi:MAG: DUF2508 family protein [Firmicutes bacterium]|nr:DUF2508 family protein [Bacillota bacterium]